MLVDKFGAVAFRGNFVDFGWGELIGPQEGRNYTVFAQAYGAATIAEDLFPQIVDEFEDGERRYTARDARALGSASDRIEIISTRSEAVGIHGTAPISAEALFQGALRKVGRIRWSSKPNPRAGQPPCTDDRPLITSSKSSPPDCPTF